MEESSEKKSSYSKKPMWQWVLIYAIVAIIIYGGFYFFFLNKNGSYNYNSSNSYNNVTPTASQSKTTTSDNIYTSKKDPIKGQYLTDFTDKTLYMYDKDSKGVSNCYGECATNWPPYTSGATSEKILPPGISVIARTDGTKQFAWKGWPLYYYVTDQKPGDITGDGVGGVWHIIKP